jgi:galactoside O-acetyltransferase
MNLRETSYYSECELHDIGFAEIGNDVRISRKCSLYSSSRTRIGSNVRIDDFCILSGPITLGSHVHIAAYCGLFGGAGITMCDFSGLSSRVSIYSTSEDYSGDSLTNPTIPIDFRKLHSGSVEIGRHAIIGCGAVVLPGAVIGEGVAIGALSLVRGGLEAWGIYAGVPASRMRERSRGLLQQEEIFLINYDRKGRE